MSYQEFKPNINLLPFIDSYWTLKTDNPKPLNYLKMPNGLNDVLIVLGDNFKTETGNPILENEHTYLTGIKTHSVNITQQKNINLIGISFKAGAFSHFHKFDSLSFIKDKIVELNNNFVPNFDLLFNNDIKNTLDTFYLRKLVLQEDIHLKIANEIEVNKGQIRIREITKKYPITDRQLERVFKEKIGLSPKEFINLTRFQYALNEIKNRASKKSLLEIAFDCGYYDHSHLSNEIKKYSGITPSQL